MGEDFSYRIADNLDQLMPLMSLLTGAAEVNPVTKNISKFWATKVDHKSVLFYLQFDLLDADANFCMGRHTVYVVCNGDVRQFEHIIIAYSNSERDAGEAVALEMFADVQHVLRELTI